jgi:hypothetical protein
VNTGDDALLVVLRATAVTAGGAVMREFNASLYPLTPEALRISESGIRAIGTFR